MQITMRKIEELRGYEKNARTHSTEQIKEIVSSILHFGFNDPVEIDSKGVIISGHGRVAAARQMGLVEVPTIQHAHMSEDAKKGYILAANRIAMSAGWDGNLLKDEFTDLQSVGFDLALTGFTQDEINSYMNPEVLTGGLVDENSVPVQR